MSSRCSIAVLALIASLVLGACGSGASFATVTSVDGDIRLAVETDIASTAGARERGLRGSPPLPNDRGLLIAFPAPDRVCIVNEGVAFAIDAVFANRNGQILAIERRIAANSTESHCQSETMYVLELAAGIAADVQPGDRLTF